MQTPSPNPNRKIIEFSQLVISDLGWDGGGEEYSGTDGGIASRYPLDTIPNTAFK